MTHIDILFMSTNGGLDKTFVEIEDSERKSIELGQWIERDDGYTVLRLPDFRALMAVLSDPPQPVINFSMYIKVKSDSTATTVGYLVIAVDGKLDDSWIRCDGQVLDPVEYPELHSVMGKPAEFKLPTQDDFMGHIVL